MLNGDALGLLAIGTDGQPILFKFNTQTYDFEIGNVNTIGTRNVLSYGGNVRFNTFDLSIAPRGDNRTELGVYIQDEIFLNNYVRLNLGARIDKFDNIEDPVFSPRVALILKPAADHAVRAVVQQGVPLAVADQQLPRHDDHQPVEPRRHQPGAEWRGLQLPGPRHRQREPHRGINRVDRSRLHRRHQQARDRVGGGVLDDQRGRDLLHADRPLPRHGAAARAGRCRRWSSKCCRRLRRARPARPAACRRSSATGTSAR